MHFSKIPIETEAPHIALKSMINTFRLIIGPNNGEVLNKIRDGKI